LALRQMTPADLPALAAIMQDAETMTAYQGPFSLEETQGWLDRVLASYTEWGHGLCSVTLPHDQAWMIGQCGLTYQDLEGEPVLEVGYLFNRAFWGHGYATEAAQAWIGYAFRALGADEVYAMVRDTNLRSMNVAIRCGMAARRRFTKHYRGADMAHLAFSVRRS
jgi:RimJ/RimL family protein N-acetyltransferase